MRHFSPKVVAGLCACVLAASAATSSSASDGDTVILTITASAPDASGPNQIELTLDDLRELGEVSIETATPWTEGAQLFTGVSLSALLDLAETEGGQIKATALNNYFVEIPASDADEFDPIVAYERNGEPMSVRDKGPLWVVYPYDAGPEYRTEVIYSRSIWQLDRIEITDN